MSKYVARCFTCRALMTTYDPAGFPHDDALIFCDECGIAEIKKLRSELESVNAKELEILEKSLDLLEVLTVHMVNRINSLQKNI